jgi:acyl-CoA thioester hydrolase
MSRFNFTKRIEVQFRDCDPLGHVNNAVFVTYLEAARFAYFRDALGYDISVPRRFILARVECDFKAQVRPHDVLDVGIAVSEIRNRSFWFDYEIVSVPEGVVVATARTAQVMFDYERQQTVAVDEEFRKRVEAFEGLRTPAS